MTTRLRDMIRAVRACKTAAEERAVIAKECASLRNAFKDNDQDYRHRNVAKLMFIHMLGYPTHFGQMECLKLIASPGFPEKRIGYLGLMLLLDERQEVLMLVTNSLKNDLNHSNQFICGLALCALGNICSSEMARDLAPEVERLLNSSISYVRKKAALCSIRIIRKVPDLVDFFILPATGLLTDKQHGVLLGGVKLATSLAEASPGALEHFRKQTPTLVRILKNLVVSGYAPEHDISGITDPFLQIRVLRLLKLVGKGDAESSDIMSDVLAQVATNTESAKNAGNAILYECVSTIMGVEAIGGLRVLAVNILGRFLSNRDNNIRYVALNTLVRVVSIDTQAVQRHRNTIVECVKDTDVSIRRRALELVYALVNDSNIENLTKELLEYLHVSDSEFKPDLTVKICALVQKHAPTKLWHFDTILKVLIEAGDYVKEDALHLLVVLISNTPDLQGYAVRSFHRAFLATWKGQESLALLTVWCIGEYGDLLVNNGVQLAHEEPSVVTESDAVDLLETVLRDVRSTVSAKSYALLALLKLSSKFPAVASRIVALTEHHRQHMVLELQQRSVEFSNILTRHRGINAALVDKIPALDESLYLARRSDSSSPGTDASLDVKPTANGVAVLPPVAASAPAGAQLIDLLDLSADDIGQPAGRDELLDILGVGSLPAGNPGSSQGSNPLLDLLSLTDAPATAPAVNLSAPTVPAGSNPLEDLLGGGSGPISTPPPSVEASPQLPSDPFADFGFSAPPTPLPGFPSIDAFDQNGLKVTFSFSKVADNPSKTSISAIYSNSSASPFTDFVLQAAVPKFMQLQMEPASSSVLPAGGVSPVTQSLHVLNTLHGQKSLVMKLRISYKVGGQAVLEQVQVNNFPAGL